MKWDDSTFRLKTEAIIAAFYKVHKDLGPGFLEEAYHNALLIELKKNFEVSSEKEFPVIYQGSEVSKYIPDIFIEDGIIVEVKAVKDLNEIHKAQLISQLRVTGALIGFLVNFSNKDLEFKRLDNFYEIERKGLKIPD